MKEQTASIRATLELVEHDLEESLKSGIGRLEADIREVDPPRAQMRLEALLPIASSKWTVRNAIKRLSGDCYAPIYVCTSWFLRECVRELTATEDEAMLFATGAEIGNLRSIERRMKLEYKEQSPVFVSADSESNRRVLREMQSSGQQLLAWIHSHPGEGAAATLPSTIDQAHQRDLELARYTAIGVILCRDGHVRFFSAESEFQVHVCGNNVTRLGKGLYCLE